MTSTSETVMETIGEKTEASINIYNDAFNYATTNNVISTGIILLYYVSNLFSLYSLHVNSHNDSFYPFLTSFTNLNNK